MRRMPPDIYRLTGFKPCGLALLGAAELPARKASRHEPTAAEKLHPFYRSRDVEIPFAVRRRIRLLAQMDMLRPDAKAGTDPVHVAKEICRKGRLRMTVESFGRAHLFKPALVHDANAIGERKSFLLIVGDEKKCGAELALKRFEFRSHMLAELRVESGQRLIEEQNRGLDDQSASERNTLPFSARQLLRQPPFLATKIEHVNHLSDAAADLGVIERALAMQPESDVGVYRQVGEQCIALEDSGDVALIWRQGGNRAAVEKNVAGRRRFKASHHAKSCGLAAPRRAYKRKKLTTPELKAHGVNRARVTETLSKRL